MNEIISKLEELKTIQKDPHLYLFNYFSDLKHDIDLEFTFKTEKIDKYMEIIDKIKLIEKDYYHNIKPIDVFQNEINLIYQQLKEDDIINKKDEVKKSIDKIKYKIEKVLFSNRSIMFINDSDDTYLLIISDIYLRKSCIESFKASHDLVEERDDCYNDKDPNEMPHDDRDKNDATMTEEKPFVYYLLKKLQTEVKNSNNNVVTIQIGNIEKVYFRKQHIKMIAPSAFNRLKDLKSICLSGNRIKEIHPLIFNELTNLEKIDFSWNMLEAIDATIFNGLTNLKQINFSWNELKAIDATIFNGLTNLKQINFAQNEIEALE